MSSIIQVSSYNKCPGGPLEYQEGVSGSSKNLVNKIFFHNRALYVRNVNRVSDSCKTGLKGYDFLWRSYVFRDVFMHNLCKIVWFLEIFCILRVVVPNVNFVI